MTTTQTIAQAAGIAPRTKRFTAVDQHGDPVFMMGEAERWEHVVSAIRLARTERKLLDTRTYTVACAVWKWMSTGRANPTVAMRVRALTPYQVCGLVAKISDTFPGEPTVGELADFWINEHAEEL